MAEKQNVTDAVTKAQAELNRIYELQQEKLRLEELLLRSANEVDVIFQRINNISTKVTDDIESSKNELELIEYVKDEKAEELNDVRRKSQEFVHKRASLRNAQAHEYKRKAEELRCIKEECKHVDSVLQQKKARVADLQEQMDVETSLFVKQRITSCDLRSKAKLDSAKLAEGHKNFQSDSAKLDAKFNKTQADIRKLREGNSTMTEALLAAQNDNHLKSIELAALRSRAAIIKEKCNREHDKQQKMLNEFLVVDEQRKVEIARMEEQISKQRAAYESLKQDDADLTERIKSEYGNSKSMAQMIEEAKAEMSELKAVCLQLTESSDNMTELIDSDEAKLKELSDKKEEICQELNRIHQQDVSMADTDESDDSDESEDEGNAIRQPMDETEGSDDDDRSSTDSRLDRSSPIHEPLQRQAETDQGPPRIRSPDSSVSTGTQNSERPDVDANNSEDAYQRRLKLFADRILFGN